MAVLGRAALLGAAAKKVPQEIVALPELGGDVIVRGMTGAERDAFEVSLVEGRGRNRNVNMKNLRAKLVVFCCIDEAGNRVLSDQDIEELGQTRADVLNRLYTVASRLSGISEEDAAELGKPVSPTASATSSSLSPVN